MGGCGGGGLHGGHKQNELTPNSVRCVFDSSSQSQVLAKIARSFQTGMPLHQMLTYIPQFSQLCLLMWTMRGSRRQPGRGQGEGERWGENNFATDLPSE